MIRFCFTRLGVPLVSNPSLRSFSAHSYANDFANPANPVLTPWFIFYCSSNGARGAGGGGGGSKFNRVFLHRWTHPNLYFSTLFITLQQKVHSRRWRSPRVKTKYTAIPHTPPLARVDVHGVIHAHPCCIKIPVFSHNYFA